MEYTIFVRTSDCYGVVYETEFSPRVVEQRGLRPLCSALVSWRVSGFSTVHMASTTGSPLHFSAREALSSSKIPSGFARRLGPFYYGTIISVVRTCAHATLTIIEDSLKLSKARLWPLRPNCFVL